MHYRAILFSGDREWSDWLAVLDTMAKYNPDLVIEGEARGLDRMAGICADFLGIPCKRMPADWERFGRSAGPRRNGEMLRHLLLQSKSQGDILVICFHDDLKRSRGTRDMAKKALRAGVGVKQIRHKKNTGSSSR